MLKYPYLFPVISTFLLASLMSWAASAANVTLSRDGQDVVIAATVQADFAGTEAVITAPDSSTIEVAIAGADFSVDGKKQLFRFEDKSVPNLSISGNGNGGIIRFNVAGKNAATAADLIQVTRDSAAATVIVNFPTVVESSAETPAQALTGAKTVSIAAVAAVAAEEKESEAEAVIAEPVKADTRPESEIPVFVPAPDKKKTASVGLERLVMTLFIVCALLAAALFGLKRWAARRGKNVSSPTKIQILTQHHLGPKKSLAIIQVAGEAILIGITDQNISMLKTLALIDDEVPGLVPKNFSDELDRDDADRQSEAEQQLAEEGYESENFALRGLSEVRDMVSHRFGSRSPRKDA